MTKCFINSKIYQNPIPNTKHPIQSLFFLLYLLYYAEVYNKLAGPISTTLLPNNTASFQEMSQRWRAVGNSVSDLTGARFEPRTFRTRDERFTAETTGRSFYSNILKNNPFE